MKKFPKRDLSNKTFGLWTVIGFDGSRRTAYWWCRCACGVEKSVPPQRLLGGKSKSCGCVRNAEFGRKAVLREWRHGLHGDPTVKKEYNAWVDMRRRCSNPKHPSFKSYGGRGISVCREWDNDFVAFLGHVGKAPSRLHSIDRIDNDRGYEPGNVRWADKLTQVANRRNTRFVMVHGEKLPLPIACRMYGVKTKNIGAKLDAGVTFESLIEGARE